MSVTIRDVMTDPALFGDQFAGDTWHQWRALLAGFYGMPLSDAERPDFLSLTGRLSVPASAFDEQWVGISGSAGSV